MTAPASSIAFKLCTTLYFSMASLTRARRRMPAVSTSTNFLSSRSTGTLTLSRVVPGSGEVIKRFSPSRRLINVDLPTFGRPMTATFGLLGLRSRIGFVAGRKRRRRGAQQRVDALPARGRDADGRAEVHR